MKLHISLLPAALGVSPRTIRRWIASGDLTPDHTNSVDDLDAQAVRDQKRANRTKHLKRGS